MDKCRKINTARNTGMAPAGDIEPPGDSKGSVGFWTRWHLAEGEVLPGDSGGNSGL